MTGNRARFRCFFDMACRCDFVAHARQAPVIITWAGAKSAERSPLAL